VRIARLLLVRPVGPVYNSVVGLVVRTPQRAAVGQGARTGVLGGTPQGRALYESLGWRVESPLTSARFTGTDA
jgi:hypothetical protein